MMKTHQRITDKFSSVLGRWMWKGTQTLQFEAEGRFPFATEYKVTVSRFFVNKSKSEKER
jgi:hypothetical protein